MTVTIFPNFRVEKHKQVRNKMYCEYIFSNKSTKLNVMTQKCANKKLEAGHFNPRSGTSGISVVTLRWSRPPIHDLYTKLFGNECSAAT
jgi:hypothetical protein